MGAVCISPRGCSFCWAVGLNANVQPLGPGDFFRQESGACSPAPAWVLGSSASQFVKKRNFSPRESPVRRWHGTCRLDPASEPPATFSSRLWSRSILKGRNRENEVSDPQRLQFQKAPPPAFRVNSVTWERFLHSPLVNVVSDLGWVE